VKNFASGKEFTSGPIVEFQVFQFI